MSVPFETLGDGQKGRMVYQVIGKDGPIFNPQNIRYLGPEDSGFPSIPTGSVLPSLASNLALGISGLNLVATVANIALTAVVLREVKKLSKQLEENRRQILDGLDRIEERLKRVDVKVQELHLREVLKHLAHSCVIGHTIDLTEIKKVEGDVTQFLSTVEDFGYVRGASFQLSYDVREKLHGLWWFLHSTREGVAALHNRKSDCNPFKVLSMDLVQDYRPQETMEFDKSLSTNIERILDTMLDDFKNRWIIQDNLDRVHRGKDEICDACGKRQKELEAIKKDEVPWLWNTDMGLVWRLHKELRALGDYQAEFPQWKRIEAVPLGSKEILVDCTWDKKLLEATA